MERYTITGFGISPEAQEQLDKGFIALIGIDPGKSDQPFKPDTVYRTGKLAYLKIEAAKHVFNVDISNTPFVYVEDGVIDLLLKQTQTDE